MRAIFAQARLHAFYLTALWFWGGILIVWQWWIAFDLVIFAILALTAILIRARCSSSPSTVCTKT